MYRNAVLIATVGLLGLGLVMIYSSSGVRAGEELGDPTLYLFRQGIWVILGGLSMMAVSSFDYRRLAAWRWPLLIVSVGLLAAVLVLGTKYNGARRWFRFGFIGVQPSEFVKLALLVFLSAHLGAAPGRPRRIFAGWIVPIAVTGLACGLTIVEPDVGTAAFLGLTALLVMAVAGCPTVCSILLGANLLLYLPNFLPADRFDHVLERFNVFLGPGGATTEKGYQAYQSLISLGSGGVTGVGLGAGLQSTFLPERFTDFIFAIVGEELGLFGTLGVVLLFGLLFYGGIKIALAAPDLFGSLLAFGLTIAITMQALINMAVVTVMVPTKGISLPLVSFGGSGLFFTLSGIGLLLSVGRAAEAAVEGAPVPPTPGALSPAPANPLPQ